MPLLNGVRGPLPARANSGGPMSRLRTERITRSILGEGDGCLPCPRREVLALDFGADDPVEAMQAVLARAGLEDPEQLRATFARGLSAMVCRAAPEAPALMVMSANAVDVLRQAFLLGLCTAVLFDPSRPLLWTQSSLTRRLELYDMGAFYQ